MPQRDTSRRLGPPRLTVQVARLGVGLALAALALAAFAYFSDPCDRLTRDVTRAARAAMLARLDTETAADHIGHGIAAVALDSVIANQVAPLSYGRCLALLLEFHTPDVVDAFRHVVDKFRHLEDRALPTLYD